MIWVSWRQHRSQAMVGLGVLCALAVYGLVLGLQMRTSFSNNNLATCLARSLGGIIESCCTLRRNRCGRCIG